MKIKVINQSGFKLPQHQTEASAGVDLFANIEEPVVLEPLSRQLIGTGLYIELPEGCEAQIRPRSGLAYKKGITVLNTPGTIDADYRGEVKVLLINLSNDTHTLEHGERIAQMVINQFVPVEWEEVQNLSDTARGTGGYGSTGT